jgi:hypothetical protein
VSSVLTAGVTVESVSTPCTQNPQPTAEHVMPCDEPWGRDQSTDQPTSSLGSLPSSRSPSDIDRTDRKLISSEFQSIQQLTAKFDLDACCNDKGDNALVPTFYCSPNNSFLQHDCSGQHVWLNPPFDQAADFIQHYLECKASSLHNTSACILLPNWRSADWRPLLKGMQVIKQYSKGSRLFEALALHCLALEPYCLVSLGV